jgi:hypothetical protein
MLWLLGKERQCRLLGISPMRDNEIPLSAAPERFFDQKKWLKFVSAMGGRDAALEQISRPEPGIIGYYRQKVGELPNAGGAQARHQEQMLRLGMQIVEEFRGRLCTGQLIATGYQLPALTRAAIPAELWKKLWPNFVADKAELGTLSLMYVRIAQASPHSGKPLTTVQRCIEWLRQRHEADGEQRKKVLQTDARRDFSQDLTVREFDAAYKAVFAKKRGRPRGQPGG